VCTVDGQRFGIGDFDAPYLLEATCKPINYCLALDESDEETVHKKVGLAPQEKGFHYLMLNSEGLPHNPMNTAGGIRTLSLIQSGRDSADIFKHILKTWEALAGDTPLAVNEDSILAHKKSSDKEYTVTYFMRENRLIPKGIEVRDIVDLFFQCHSIEITAKAQAVVAATLANAGISPLTGKKIFKPRTVKNCLSLMYSSGMEGYNGNFGFIVGLPAKSGVSGAIMLIVPNVMGICVWSPKIDHNGISVRGLDFCKKFIEKFNFHNYDSLMKTEDKTDPRLQKNEAKMRGVMALVDAASRGDLFEVQKLFSVDVDINEGDYDDRTPLHLAASEGHAHIIEFLINNKVEINPKDRWGGTPLADAERGKHKDVISLLEKNGGRI
jgi:glutaminase